MCNFWYSQALKTLGIDCPSTQKETDDFLSEVKNTLNIENTWRLTTIITQSV